MFTNFTTPAELEAIFCDYSRSQSTLSCKYKSVFKTNQHTHTHTAKKKQKKTHSTKTAEKNVRMVTNRVFRVAH